jgi:hypothetical protein
MHHLTALDILTKPPALQTPFLSSLTRNACFCCLKACAREGRLCPLAFAIGPSPLLPPCPLAQAALALLCQAFAAQSSAAGAADEVSSANWQTLLSDSLHIRQAALMVLLTRLEVRRRPPEVALVAEALAAILHILASRPLFFLLDELRRVGSLSENSPARLHCDRDDILLQGDAHDEVPVAIGAVAQQSTQPVARGAVAQQSTQREVPGAEHGETQQKTDHDTLGGSSTVSKQQGTHGKAPGLERALLQRDAELVLEDVFWAACFDVLLCLRCIDSIAAQAASFRRLGSSGPALLSAIASVSTDLTELARCVCGTGALRDELAESRSGIWPGNGAPALLDELAGGRIRSQNHYHHSSGVTDDKRLFDGSQTRTTLVMLFLQLAASVTSVVRQRPELLEASWHALAPCCTNGLRLLAYLQADDESANSRCDCWACL